MLIDRLDHLVLTVTDIEATIEFYTRVLGMAAVALDGHHALHFGRQKINLHRRGHEFEPKADRPMPGSGDLCLIAAVSLAEMACTSNAARSGGNSDRSRAPARSDRCARSISAIPTAISWKSPSTTAPI